MKLWLLTGTASGYDTYDGVVVAAANEEKAKQILPSPYMDWRKPSTTWSWAESPDQVTAKLIGTAVKGTPEGVILDSFNAG